MSENPLNLALRFLLELALLAALGYWGWTQPPGALRWLAALGLPLAAAAAWAVFRVPGDGGAPLVVTPGPARLLLEAVLFTLGTLALQRAGQPRLALLFAIVALLHYAVSYDRVWRFLRP